MSPSIFGGIERLSIFTAPVRFWRPCWMLSPERHSGLILRYAIVVRRLIAYAYTEIIANPRYQIKYFSKLGVCPGEDRLFFSASCKRC